MKLYKWLFLQSLLICMLVVHSNAQASAVRATLTPKQYQEIVSPVSGLMEKIQVRNGQAVSQGDVLATLYSSFFKQDFSQKFIAYLYAEQDLAYCQKNQANYQSLYGSKSASAEEYQVKEMQLLKAQYNYFIAESQLNGLQDRLMQPIKISQIKADNLPAIKKLINSNQLVHIPVTALNNGIVLFPMAHNHTGDLLVKGKVIKEFQTLFYVADMSQLVIAYDENASEKLSVGDKLTVTNNSAPHLKFNVEVTAVNGESIQSKERALQQVIVKLNQNELDQRFYQNFRPGITVDFVRAD